MAVLRTGAGAPPLSRLIPAAAVLPVLLTAGHLIGGGSGAGAAAILTAATAVTLLSLSLLERRPYSAIYLSGLVWLGPPVALLAVWLLAGLVPGSHVVAQGSLARLVGAHTLAIDPQAAWLECLKLGGLATTVLAAERLAASARRLRKTLRILIGCGVVWTLWSMLLLAVDAGSSGAGRLSGAFVSPNVAGALIVISLLLLVGDNPPRDDPSAGAQSWPRRLRPALLGVILLTGLVLTASRACTLLGLVLAGSLWLWPRRRSLLSAEGGATPLKFICGLALALLVGVGLLAGASLLSRLSRTANDAQDRWAILEVFAKAAEQAPLTGYGLGSVSALSRMLISKDNYSYFFNIRAAHNWVMQWWVEGGLIGLALVLVLLAITAFRVCRGLGPRGREALGGPLAALVFLLVHGLVDYELQIYSITLTAALLSGLCLAGAGHSDRYWARFRRASRRKRRERSIHASPNPDLAARFSVP